MRPSVPETLVDLELAGGGPGGGGGIGNPDASFCGVVGAPAEADLRAAGA
jgi:hypothetical protein